MNNKGQFSIIAALLISIILVSTVILTYTVILNDSIQVQPQVLTAIDETNFAIKQMLGFSVGYYGSVIRVTGDTSFANQSTFNYTTSGLEYVANTHAEWGAGFSLTNLTVHTYWFNNTSYSTGYLRVTYNLTKLGIYGAQYAPSCGLTVQIANTTQNNQTSLIVTRDQNEPITDLEQRNFQFFQYQTANSTWTLVSPSTSPIAYTNGTYQIQPPAGIDANSYVIQVEDQRGIIVVASPYSSYGMDLTWPSTSSTMTPSYYYVNNNSSDVDTNGNMGTQLNFTAQQYAPDKINDTLTEADTALSSFGNTQQGSSSDSIENYIRGSIFTSPAYSVTAQSITAYIQVSATHTAKAAIYTSTGTFVAGTQEVSVTTSNDGWVTFAFATGSQPTLTASTNYILVVWANSASGSAELYRGSSGSGTSRYLSQTYGTWPNSPSFSNGSYNYSIYCNCSTSPNYRLDIEEQWANVDFTGTNKELDIFTGPVSSPAENLSVQWWNMSGSSWLTIIPSLTANSWNNVSVTTYLTNPTFTIRFSDGTQTGDSIQNSWQIDATLLHIDTNNTLSNVRDTITIELLQNGTMRWLGQNLQLSTQTNQTMPIPPLPVKSIHVNQTTNGVDSEVPFQIEDWASDYLIPLGLTSNSSVFSDGNMIVFLINNNVSRVTIWWNGSDLATQTPYAFVDRYFTGDNPSAGRLTNGILTLQFTGDFQPVVSSIGSVSCTATFMRMNNQPSTYGAGLAYIISSGVVRDIVQQEAEWSGGGGQSGGVANCPNIYSHIVLTLPANATYYTFELRGLFVQSQQNRTITDMCPIELQSSFTQVQTENGMANGYPIVSNATGTFYNQSSVWAHHWSQLISGANGAGIMFTDTGNSQLYSFDSLAGTQTGELRVNATARTIELLPVEIAPVSFTFLFNTIWCGAVSTFSNTTPIYQTASGQVSGSWISVEYPPTVAVYTGH